MFQFNPLQRYRIAGDFRRGSALYRGRAMKRGESDMDELTVRQKHEINQRVRTHTERVQAELELIRFPKYDRQGRRIQP